MAQILMSNIPIQPHLNRERQRAPKGNEFSMKKTISGTCTTTHWLQQGYNLEHGIKLSVAEKESTFIGGIEGKSIVRYTTVNMKDGTRTFTGYIRITGRIGDREGSFVVEDTGRGNTEQTNGTWKILADAATGDLVGIKERGGWKWEKGNKHEEYTLTYEF